MNKGPITSTYRFLCEHRFIVSLRNAHQYTSCMFSFLKCQTVFQNDETILHYHGHYTSVSIPPHSHQQLVLPLHFYFTILIGV